MDKILESMWQEINEKYFHNELLPLADIQWLEISGDGGIGAHGVYYPKSKAIVIDMMFRPDLDRLKDGDKTEHANLEISFLILIHEMIHQVLYQKVAPHPGGHGTSFISEAERIAKLLIAEGKNVTPPTEKNSHHWPW